MKRLLQISAIVIAIGFLWFGLKHYQGKLNSSALKESGEPLDASGEEHESEVVKTEAAPQKLHQVKPESALRLDQLFEQYGCKQRVDCERAINVANSRMEALWLERRGYPSESELLDLQGMPFEKLKRMAEAKNLAAMAVYGDRLIKSGKVMEGLAQLHQAVLYGSTFAMYKSAETFQNEPSVGDLSESAAYYRLAYLDGDWKAPVQLYLHHPRITIGELETAERRASVLYYRILEQKAKQRLSLQIGVRPFEE